MSDLDEQRADEYRYCIKHNLALPEELIEWFYDKCDEVVAMNSSDVVLSAVRRWKLSYSPTRWASIQKMEARGV